MDSGIETGVVAAAVVGAAAEARLEHVFSLSLSPVFLSSDRASNQELLLCSEERRYFSTLRAIVKSFPF